MGAQAGLHDRGHQLPVAGRARRVRDVVGAEQDRRGRGQGARHQGVGVQGAAVARAQEDRRLPGAALRARRSAQPVPLPVAHRHRAGQGLHRAAADRRWCSCARRSGRSIRRSSRATPTDLPARCPSWKCRRSWWSGCDRRQRPARGPRRPSPRSKPPLATRGRVARCSASRALALPRAAAGGPGGSSPGCSWPRSSWRRWQPTRGRRSRAARRWSRTTPGRRARAMACRRRWRTPIERVPYSAQLSAFVRGLGRGLHGPRRPPDRPRRRRRQQRLPGDGAAGRVRAAAHRLGTAVVGLWLRALLGRRGGAARPARVGPAHRSRGWPRAVALAFAVGRRAQSGLQLRSRRADPDAGAAGAALRLAVDRARSAARPHARRRLRRRPRRHRHLRRQPRSVDHHERRLLVERPPRRRAARPRRQHGLDGVRPGVLAAAAALRRQRVGSRRVSRRQHHLRAGRRWRPALGADWSRRRVHLQLGHDGGGAGAPLAAARRRRARACTSRRRRCCGGRGSS